MSAAERTAEAALEQAAALARAGRAQEAVDLLNHALRLAQDAHPAAGEAQAAGARQLRLGLAELLMTRGQGPEAAQLLAPLVAAHELAGHRDRLQALRLDGELAEARGDQATARLRCEQQLAWSVTGPGLQARWARLGGVKETPSHRGVTLFAEAAPSRYRIIRPVGVGGSAAVYQAEEVPLGRVVALKLLHGSGSPRASGGDRNRLGFDQDPAPRARVLREARMAARFDHPGVVQVLDADPDRGLLVLDWHPHGSLHRAIHDGSCGGHAITAATVAGWFGSLFDTLAMVHDAGVVHRDVKPSNLLLRDASRLAIADFGQALEAGSVPERLGPGGVGGTPAFMPPEHARQATAAGDVFAAGVCIRMTVTLLAIAGMGRWLQLAERCMSKLPRARPSAASVRDEVAGWA